MPVTLNRVECCRCRSYLGEIRSGIRAVCVCGQVTLSRPGIKEPDEMEHISRIIPRALKLHGYNIEEFLQRSG